MDVSFALLREGSSDEGLTVVLRDLLLLSGFDRVSGLPRDYRGTTSQKLEALERESSDVTVAFVHRDADDRSALARRREIEDASKRFSGVTVPIVPIRTTEAWLLVDQDQIRKVAGKPNSNADLSIPPLGRIESLADPKECLKNALMLASETKGRRRREQTKRFATNRRVLLERLDPNGAVTELSSWRSLQEDLCRLSEST